MSMRRQPSSNSASLRRGGSTASTAEPGSPRPAAKKSSAGAGGSTGTTTRPVTRTSSTGATRRGSASTGTPASSGNNASSTSSGRRGSTSASSPTTPASKKSSPTTTTGTKTAAGGGRRGSASPSSPAQSGRRGSTSSSQQSPTARSGRDKPSFLNAPDNGGNGSPDGGRTGRTESGLSNQSGSNSASSPKRVTPQHSTRSMESSMRQGSEAGSTATGPEGGAGSPSNNEPPRPETPPPKEKTPEELEIERLEAEKVEREEELTKVESKIKDANMFLRSINMVEKAHSLDEKSDENTEEIKKMKKEIQYMRNSDRIMVSLKDTKDNMAKHLRMRSAHIRQKEATIDLIDQRCQEQVQKVHNLLDTMAVMTEKLSEETEKRRDREAYTKTVDPLISAAAMVREDAKDEEFIIHVQLLTEDLRKLDESLSRDLESTYTNLDGRAWQKAEEKEVEKETIKRLWTDEKRTLMGKYMTATKHKAENHFHIKRGSHIKGFDVLNSKAPSSSTEDLRKLYLIEEENLLANEQLRKEKAMLEKKINKDGTSSARQADEAGLKKLLQQLQTQRSNLEKENDRLHEQHSRLQGEYTSNTPLIGANPYGTPTRSASGRAGGDPTTPLSATRRSKTASEAATPPKFTRDTLQRLQQPTKSRKTHLDAHEEDEIRRREIINKVRMNRPQGVDTL